MAITILQSLEVIEVMENFMEKKRPPENIRHQVDLSYKIEGQSVILFELRPRWNKPEEIIEFNIAKANFVKTKDRWKIFWQRSDRKWRSYSPKPIVKTLREFVKLVDEDRHGCFWG